MLTVSCSLVRSRLPVAASVAIACCAALSGCLVNSNQHDTLTGTYVSEQTFSQIQPGVTTKQWVMGTLGEPTCETDLGDGNELWKWEYSRAQQNSGSVLFIFHSSKSLQTAGAAYVQMKNGVVTKTWRSD